MPGAMAMQSVCEAGSADDLGCYVLLGQFLPAGSDRAPCVRHALPSAERPSTARPMLRWTASSRHLVRPMTARVDATHAMRQADAGQAGGTNIPWHRTCATACTNIFRDICTPPSFGLFRARLLATAQSERNAVRLR